MAKYIVVDVESEGNAEALLYLYKQGFKLF